MFMTTCLPSCAQYVAIHSHHLPLLIAQVLSNHPQLLQVAALSIGALFIVCLMVYKWINTSIEKIQQPESIRIKFAMP